MIAPALEKQQRHQQQQGGADSGRVSRQSHLLTHSPCLSLAEFCGGVEDLKQQGNGLYKAGYYPAALRTYERAVRVLSGHNARHVPEHDENNAPHCRQQDQENPGAAAAAAAEGLLVACVLNMAR